MKSNQRDIPGLRFPEFVETWDARTLGKVADFLDERRRPLKESDRSKMSGPYPYYGASGIIDYVNDFIFDDELILLGEDGENILSRALPLAFRVSGKCWVNNHAHVVKPKEGTSIDFLCHYLENISYVEYNTGTAQPKLNQEVCKRIPLRLPTLPEQQQIAAFLSAVDEKITRLARKKELLLKYKKGVMQHIFSQEIRFKDDNGKHFPDWEEKEIMEVAPLQRGFDLPVDKIIGGEFPVVFSNGILRTHSEAKAKAPGVVTGRSGTIGKVIYVEKDYWPHNTSLWVTDFKGNHPKFIFYFYINFKLERFATGSGVPTLNRNDVHTQKALIPNSSEQIKIANFISAIDEKINLVNQQLEKTRAFKKGLLQQMFV